MSIFDLIPTVGEIIGKVVCTLSDHEWVRLKDGTDVCNECGKIK